MLGVLWLIAAPFRITSNIRTMGQEGYVSVLTGRNPLTPSCAMWDAAPWNSRLAESATSTLLTVSQTMTAITSRGTFGGQRGRSKTITGESQGNAEPQAIRGSRDGHRYLVTVGFAPSALDGWPLLTRSTWVCSPPRKTPPPLTISQPLSITAIPPYSIFRDLLNRALWRLVQQRRLLW